MRTRRYLLLLFAGLFVWLGFGVDKVLARPVIRSGVNGGVDWTEGVVFAIGKGIAPRRATGLTQGRMLARRAAVVDGYRNLAEITQGVQITSNWTVRDEMVTGSRVQATVHAVIKGAELVDEKFEDGVAIVKLAMPIGGKMMQALIPRDKFRRLVQNKGFSSLLPLRSSFLNGLFQLFLPTEAHAAVLADFPFKSDQEVQTTRKILDWLEKMGPGIGIHTLRQNITAYEKQVRFTGVVVDASQVPSFEMATVPFLKTPDGTSVYPNPETDYDHVVRNRVASYDFDVEDAVRNKRVAKQPFIIKALGTYRSKKSDLVISHEDAARVRRLSSISQSFAKTRVIIVVAE